jgi:uncharacterized protein YjbI with pentapeptide repeats
MHTYPQGGTRRLGLRPVGVVSVGTRIAAIVVVGLSIFATAWTSGASAGVKNRCVPRPKADLEGCDLSHVNLKDSNLTGADLDGANLSGAILSGAILTHSTWSNTTCPDGTNSNKDGDTCENNLG